jgi:hypothetical protein
LDAFNHPEIDKKLNGAMQFRKNEIQRVLGKIQEVGDSHRTKLYKKWIFKTKQNGIFEHG